ncbi:MAG: hypothetical protein U9P50_01945 [Patescibacteria group bacterium]|nr:hypothetical protein [Patescibacteria group bacterium]
MAKEKQKIDNITAALMIGTAILIDSIQALLTMILIGPFVNWMISIFAWMTFFLWFILKGVRFTSNPKRVFTFLGGSLLEAVPIIATLPVWTAVISTTIFTMRAERKLKSSLGKPLASPLSKVIKSV